MSDTQQGRQIVEQFIREACVPGKHVQVRHAGITYRGTLAIARLCTAFGKESVKDVSDADTRFDLSLHDHEMRESEEKWAPVAGNMLFTVTGAERTAPNTLTIGDEFITILP